MKVTCEKLEDSQVLLQMEVEPERTAKAMDQAYRRLVNRVNIPGFRKGKAPRHVVERMVGHDALVQEGIDLLIPQLYKEAVEETGIHPIDEPSVDIAQQEPLVVKMTVPVRPSVQLGDYQSVEATRETVSVDDQEVDRLISDLREDHAEWVPVERAAAVEDRVRIDVSGRLRGSPVLYNPSGSAILESETGEAVVDQKGAEYTIEPDSVIPVKGFAKELVGLQAGEQKRFEITFPPEYPDPKLANKAVIFQVKVFDVKEKHLPVLDDEFAKSVGDFDSLEALRNGVRDKLRRRKEADAEERLRQRVVNMLTSQAKIELPETLIERETERLAENAERRLRQANVSIAEYLRATKKSNEELRADYRTDAVANLRRYLILEEIAQAENIEVTPEEVDAEIARVRDALGEHGAKVADALNEPGRRDELAADLRQRKTLDRLVAIATAAEEKRPEPPGGEQTSSATLDETSEA